MWSRNKDATASLMEKASRVRRKMLEAGLMDPSVNDSLYRDLAGNAFTCSITLAIFIAIMTNVTEGQKDMLKNTDSKRRRIEPRLGSQDIQDMVGIW